MSCQRVGCSNTGVKVPIIKIAAYPGGAEAEGSLPLPHCEECAAMTILDDVMNDKAFEMITAAFEKAGYTKPDRSTARLEWRDFS